MVSAQIGHSSTTYGCKQRVCYLVMKNESKSLEKVSPKMWWDGENDSPNVEFIWNYIPVK
jgi:hypothetical protein